MDELVQIGPISPLRQRLPDDMAQRRFGPSSPPLDRLALAAPDEEISDG